MQFFANLSYILGSIVGGIMLITHTLFAALSGEVSFYAPVVVQTVTQTQNSPAPLPTNSGTTASSTALRTSTTVSSPALVKALPKKPAIPASPTVSTPTPLPSTPQPVALLPTEQVNSTTRSSLVNILCTTKSGGSFNPISGSGVIIDTRGIILTNAHVAQYFLLSDYLTPGNIDCLIRTGSPATPQYRATLLYLPPVWIDANASQIVSDKPTGTGENDYAFLFITGSANPSTPLPSSFPALGMSSSEPSSGDQTLLAAYPAGFLDGITIATNLSITSAVASIGQLFTFNDPANIDVFSVGGTVVSQSGSSGGAVVRLTDNKLIGLIATDTASPTTAGRDLHAITLAFIDRSLRSLGKGGIVGLLTQDPLTASALFNAKVAPGEAKTLIDVLKK